MIFYFLYYSDNVSKIDGIKTQIENVEMDIKKKKKKEGQRKQMEEEIKAKKKIWEDLKEVLPEEKEISQIISKVQAIISSARLRILNWTGQSERKKEIYTEIPISISLEGSYHNLAIFFDQLSRLKKIFTVDNLTINPLPQMTNIFSISASFTASTYTYRERGASAAGSK